MAIAEKFRPQLQPVRVGLAGEEALLSPVGTSLEAEAMRHSLQLRMRRFETDGHGARVSITALMNAARAAGFGLLHCADPLRRELTELILDSAVIADRSQLYDTIYLDETDTLHGCDAGTLGLQDALSGFLADRPADHVLILGAGAEGQSAALALAGLGVRRLTFHDPDLSRAASLANLMQQRDGLRCTLLASAEGIFHEFSRPGMTRGWIDGIVHAPTWGTGAELPGIAGIAPPLWVADPGALGMRATRMAQEARAAGCALLTGDEIARHRGARVLACALSRGASQPCKPLHIMRNETRLRSG